MMKVTIGFNQFCDRFRDMGREDQFTYEGKRALFDWLEEFEEETGIEEELDIIALCCDFIEYESLAKLQDDYPDIGSIEELENHTIVIRIDDECFIIQSY